MVKTPCSDKLQMQKGLWNEDGDERTVAYVPKHNGTGNWATFSKRSASGQKRSGKSSSRERWNNGNSKCDPKHKSFTTQEEELVIQLHAAIGSRWPIIAQQLPGRTDNDVKTLWNSKLRKKLSAMGIDPVTHKPFSQILTDYGNIGAFPKARPHFSSLSRDLKNANIVFKPTDEKQPSHNNNNDNHHQNPSYHNNFSHFDHLFSSSSSSSPNTNQSSLVISNIPQYPIDFNYSQLQAANDCATSSSAAVNGQDFCWSDFFLEDSVLPCSQGDEKLEDPSLGMIISTAHDDDKLEEVKQSYHGEASSSSNSTLSFVEAMIESQDDMFSQLPCFYEEQFY